MAEKQFDNVELSVAFKDYSQYSPDSEDPSKVLTNLTSGENIGKSLGKTKRWIEILLDGTGTAMAYKKTGATLTADSVDTTKCSITVVGNVREGYTTKVTSIASSPAYTGNIAVGDLLIALKDNPKVTSDWVVDTDWAVLSMGGYPKFSYVTGDVYEHVTGNEAPTFVTDTYYSRSGSVYTVLSTEPDDWETDWKKYYEKSTGKYIAIDYGN